jgi:hypothetical protein
VKPGQKGAIAEAAVLAAAVKLHIPVLVPFNEGSRYDLVFDLEGRLTRVQCKWGTVHGDVVRARLSTSRLTPQGYVRTTYARREIDAFAVYCADLDCCYWLPIEEFAGQSYVHLRLTPARNNQRQLVKWAAHYEFGAIAQLGERLAGSQKVAGSSPASSTETKPLF